MSYTCVNSHDARTLIHTHALTQKHIHTRIRVDLELSGLTHQSEYQLSSVSLSRCPSLFYAVPHTLSLFVFFSYTPTRIPCICCFFSPLRVWGRIWHCFSAFVGLLTSQTSSLCKCHTHMAPSTRFALSSAEKKVFNYHSSDWRFSKPVTIYYCLHDRTMNSELLSTAHVQETVFSCRYAE